MNKEKTFVVLALLAVATIWLWKMGVVQNVVTDVASGSTENTDPNISTAPTPSNQSGLDYLLYNQPWYFGPPVQNVMPYLTNGLAGQNPDQTANQNNMLYPNGGA